MDSENAINAKSDIEFHPKDGGPPRNTLIIDSHHCGISNKMSFASTLTKHHSNDEETVVLDSVGKSGKAKTET